MNRPSQTDYALTNPLVLAVTFVASLGLLNNFRLQVQNHQSPSLLLPLGALLLCKQVRGARARVAAYRNWQGAWAEMSGEAPRIAAGKRQRQRMGWMLVAFTLWFLLLGWLCENGTTSATPGYTPALLIVLGLTAWAMLSVLRLLGRLIGPVARRSPATRDSSHVVSACVAVPWRSPGPSEFTRALPKYCVALLTRGDGAQPQASTL
jgi:hypothetical protein